MKYFFGLAVFLIATVVTAQRQDFQIRITPSEEAELKRVNVIRSQDLNDQISLREDERNPSVHDNYKDLYQQEEFVEPVSANLKPKPKFANYRPVTYFAWELFQHTNNENVQNYVLSPLSPQLLLSQLVTGADGITKNEIVNAIKYSEPSQLGHLVSSMLQSTTSRELNIASAFFVNRVMNLEERFLQDSVSRNVDVIYAQFSNPGETKKIVNKWVSDKTKHKITNLQLPTDSDTRMFMSSVVYFSAKWLYSFKPVSSELFYSREDSKYVKMMNIKKKFNYGSIDGLGQWVSVPYDSAESMVVIFPDARIGLDKMIERMTDGVFLNITENISKEETQANVDLTMPTFSISSLVSLVEPFKKMGMNSLFTAEANFSKLSKKERIQLSNAQQQSILEVNEFGTVAASLTTFTVVALSFSAPIPSVTLRINRPFLCIIVDRDTNIPLFVAKISKPQ